MKNYNFLGLLILSISFLMFGCKKKLNIDLAVTAFNVEIKQHISTPTLADVYLTGVVKNIGESDYISGESQQLVNLYESVPGVSTPNVRKSISFTNLDMGEEVILRDTIRNWSKATEFPNNYRVEIVYDPDIYIDGNEHNDDINSSNNFKEILGTFIHSLFPI